MATKTTTHSFLENFISKNEWEMLHLFLTGANGKMNILGTRTYSIKNITADGSSELNPLCIKIFQSFHSGLYQPRTVLEVNTMINIIQECRRLYDEAENSWTGLLVSAFQRTIEIDLDPSPIEQLEKTALPYLLAYEKYELTEVIIQK